MSLRIAALVPASRMFAGVDHTFVAGLRGALAERGVAHELTIEPAGNAAMRDQIADKVQRIVLAAPDVATAVLGAGMSRHVHAAFNDAGIPFILNDTGADPLMTGGASNPFLFSNSLNLWQSMFALGYWAAREHGPRVCVSAGFHEAGFGIVQAFWHGVAEGGGAVVATEVTHRATAVDDPSEALGRLAAHDPDALMAFYSGREGISFMRAYAALGLASHVRLLSTPWMTHGQWLPQMPPEIEGVRTASSWNMELFAERHDRFRRAAPVTPAREPAIFALLGYETGMAIAAASAREGSAPLREKLEGLAFESPRGDLRFDPDRREVGSVDYLQEIRRESGGGMKLAAVATLPLPDAFGREYAACRNSEERAGWINPYLVS